jgi:hypothetical protein
MKKGLKENTVITKQVREIVDPAKAFVDMVCTKQIDNLLGDTCDLKSLQKFATLNNINWKDTDSKGDLCNKIGFKYEKDELINTLSVCQKSIDNLVAKTIGLNNKEIEGDILQLQAWWDKNLGFANDAISKESLTKTREFKNLIRQTCNTFVTGIDSKVTVLQKRQKRFSLF